MWQSHKNPLQGLLGGGDLRVGLFSIFIYFF
nr:MAG TPA: hypothetical protein [Caudoviricetes sp.]